MEKCLVEEVFTTNGLPEITYVEPKEYNSFVVAIRTRGKCLVIEGPSGIGKTTAVKKALSKLNLEYNFFSARKQSDFEAINQIAQGYLTGINIIDDFHRLPSYTQKQISDVMKYLADEGAMDKKIIVIGINRVGDSLVKFSSDLNNRISTIKFETNSDDKIRELIEKGETALNIKFDKANDIIRNTYGSFHITQLMCQKACIENNILETQDKNKVIHFSYAKTSGSMIEEFARSYFETARLFATGPRLRREGRAPYLHVLKWLAENDAWTVNLTTAIQQHPSQKTSVSQIIDKGYLEAFLNNNDKISEYLHFDPNTSVLSAEDPKFIFYLKAINWNNFATDIGFIQLIEEPQYDYALSFAGTQREVAEKIFTKLTENEISVFYDKNEEADSLSMDVEEYLAPIYNSKAMYIIPLLSKDYPTRVWTRFESNAFKSRFGQNAVIPIWWDNVEDSIFDESKKYVGMTFKVNEEVDSQIDYITNNLVKKIRERRLQK